MCRKGLGCGFGKSLFAFIIKCQGNNDLLISHIVLLVASLGVSDLGAGDNSVAVIDDLLQFLSQDVFHIAAFSDAELIVFLALVICLADKVQRAGTTQILQDLVRLRNAGNTGNLDIQAVGAFCIYLSFRAVLIDTALQFILCIVQVFLGRRLLAHRLVSDAGAARQIQTFFDVVIGSSVSLAKTDQHRIGHQS